MDVHVLTVFPRLYQPFLEQGLLAKGQERGAIEVTLWSLRRFSDGDTGTIDDYAYGGEYGMVLKPEPFFRGVEHIRETRGQARVALMAPDGECFDNDAAKALSDRRRLIILSGRYEGIDWRVREHLADELWSIGPYVTPGGDLPALVMISAIARHIPGVVSNPTSVKTDSYQNDSLAPPHYTRPARYRDYSVPEVLRSGDHGRIAEWRRRRAKDRTRDRRPGLLQQGPGPESYDQEPNCEDDNKP